MKIVVSKHFFHVIKILNIYNEQFLTFSIHPSFLPDSPRDESQRMTLSLLYPPAWQKARGISIQLGQELLQKGLCGCPLSRMVSLSVVASPSPAARQTICWCLPPAAISSWLSLLPWEFLTVRHMVFSPAPAQPGSLSWGSCHNLSPTRSITLFAGGDRGL